MTNLVLKNAIKSEAKRLGFHLVGITTPDPPPHLAIYEQWLEAGHHAGMDWMGTARNRERRANPRLILPECQSILVLGMAYPPLPSGPQTAHQNNSSLNTVNADHPVLEGQTASYAWGDDYHEVFPERLATIVEFIEKQVGKEIPNRWYTDTGPILERELAQRAGLGWIGKNTCLINPQAGSYFLLSEILLGIELPSDAPITTDHCGSCTRCIEACPTDCILPNRTIDANRCISYLTIEEKGPLARDLRPKIGNWLFGCDICQQVCPWNLRFALPADEPRLAARPGRATPSLKDELGLTPEAFNRKFKGSPVKRTKRRGYLRNVVVALGNTGNLDMISTIRQALTDPEPLIRSHAAWALGNIGGEHAHRTLIHALETETDVDVVLEIQSALSDIQSAQTNHHPQNNNP